jgi:L-alanine-DL-glutamate epimerase-like enolase superfamily enzyme
MWPLEKVFWDLAGKIHGQPIWKMLVGGCYSCEKLLFAKIAAVRE